MVDDNGERFEAFVRANQWFLPSLLLIPMALGLYFQNKLSKTDQSWAG
jgi:hypothetical protein